MSEKHIGEVVQVIGPVLDIRFAHDELPPLLNAIEIDNDGAKLVAEVAQQVGDDVVRCIAMNSTDGLVRGAKALDTGGPISVPVGEECLGRVFKRYWTNQNFPTMASSIFQLRHSRDSQKSSSTMLHLLIRTKRFCIISVLP